mmetsp:Transcript_53288/g.116993  ORF Transcript_53288/g.116993 Transcript_53288/m.116993 type:complete len:240 (-) Transcript_53288:515-1234(-)
MWPFVVALLLVRRLVTDTLPGVFVTAIHFPRPGPLAARDAALAPLSGLVGIAPRPVLASLLRRRLWREGTLVVLSRGAGHLTSLQILAALGLARAPAPGYPRGSGGSEVIRHSVRGRQRRQIIVLGASCGLLADQVALRLRASLGAPTVPSALWSVANILAWHMIRAVQRTRRPRALRRALRRGALLVGILVAGLLRAEHGAFGLRTIDLALRIVWLRAACLAGRLSAIRSAILIAELR